MADVGFSVLEAATRITEAWLNSNKSQAMPTAEVAAAGFEKIFDTVRRKSAGK